MISVDIQPQTGTLSADIPLTCTLIDIPPIGIQQTDIRLEAAVAAEAGTQRLGRGTPPAAILTDSIRTASLALTIGAGIRSVGTR